MTDNTVSKVSITKISFKQDQVLPARIKVGSQASKFAHKRIFAGDKTHLTIFFNTVVHNRLN